MRKLIPLGDRVLVRRVVAQMQTAGGVYLPDAGTKKENEAEVVAIGPGFRTEDGSTLAMDVAVGDTVLLPEYGLSLIHI